MLAGQLWPRVNHAVSTMGRQQLDPLMKESKPSWISSVQLDRFDMGDNAPQVSGVKVYQAAASGADEVLIELDVGWTSDAEMSMIVHPMPHQAWLATPVVEILSKLIVVKVGVEKVTLSGRVRITMKPLMDELPIVAAMQIAFVEMPNFNFDLTLYGGDIGFLPGLEAWITTVIKDSVLRPYVLPDHYILPVIPGDFNQIDKPRGMLFVTIVSARNVPKMDWFNGSDPYVRLFVRDKRKLKTQVKENTTRPTWNEEFQLLIHEPDHQHLTLEMFDHDVLSVDDEIGRGSFAIRNLRNGIEEEVEIEIKEQMGQQVDQMMIMKLVDKIDTGLNKVRSLTHLLTKKPDGGPCLLKCKLTYFEFAKEELEVLDIPTGTNNSSFTSTSDDTLDSGEDSGELAQNGRDHPAGEMEDEYYQQQRRQPGEEEIQRPSGARQYKVHRQSEQSEPGGTSGARQYRVHREGQQSARVEKEAQKADRHHRFGAHSDSQHSVGQGREQQPQGNEQQPQGSEQQPHGSEQQLQGSEQRPQHRRAFESDLQDGPNSQHMQGTNQHSLDRQSESNQEGNTEKHPWGTTQSQGPALSEMRHNNTVAEEGRVGREGVYQPSRPTTTHQRPREHTATHDRPRTVREREQEPGGPSDSANSSQHRHRDMNRNEQEGEEEDQDQDQAKGEPGETDGKESPLEQSLREMKSSRRRGVGKPNERVMNVLQGGLLYVEIRKASGLMSKPLYMMGRPALPDLITVKVTVAGEEKFTAAAKGKDAAVDETLEFILGRKEIDAHEDLSVDIEVWDYRLINHFKGRLSIPFKEIARNKRMKDNFSLQGVRRGQLTLSLSWMGISDAK